MDITDPETYTEIFLVEELMEADLHQIIRSEQPLTDAHFQYFIYQVCRGLKYIHSANVLHRDLKPGNLLVNADCELKICDFGLARGLSATPTGFMTEYVATRWYRAPEIMLSFKCYTKAIDMWSVGCIFAELLGGKPLFKGRDYVDQLNQILSILGTPDDSTLRRIGSERAQLYIRSLPRMKKVPWAQLYPKASPAALDLIEKLLTFDPALRITVEEALEHPYLEAYHDIDDEPTHPDTFDFEFESLESMDDMKTVIAQEVVDFKRLINENKGYPLSGSRVQSMEGMDEGTNDMNIDKDRVKGAKGAAPLSANPQTLPPKENDAETGEGPMNVDEALQIRGE